MRRSWNSNNRVIRVEFVMEKIHYKILDFLDDADGRKVARPKIEQEFSTVDEDKLEEALRYLHNNEMAHRDSIADPTRYKISVNGLDALSDRELRGSIESLNSSIDNLLNFQAKSSAVETIFTLFLLGFAYLQYLQRARDPIIGTLFGLVGLFWAVLVGGDNLTRVSLRRLKSLPDIHVLKHYVILIAIVLMLLTTIAL